MLLEHLLGVRGGLIAKFKTLTQDETTHDTILISFFFHVYVHLSVRPSVSVFMCEQQETEGGKQQR